MPVAGYFRWPRPLSGPGAANHARGDSQRIRVRAAVSQSVGEGVWIRQCAVAESHCTCATDGRYIMVYSPSLERRGISYRLWLLSQRAHVHGRYAFFGRLMREKREKIAQKEREEVSDAPPPAPETPETLCACASFRAQIKPKISTTFANTLPPLFHYLTLIRCCHPNAARCGEKPVPTL